MMVRLVTDLDVQQCATALWWGAGVGVKQIKTKSTMDLEAVDPRASLHFQTVVFIYQTYQSRIGRSLHRNLTSAILARPALLWWNIWIHKPWLRFSTVGLMITPSACRHYKTVVEEKSCRAWFVRYRVITKKFHLVFILLSWLSKKGRELQ